MYQDQKHIPYDMIR